MDERAIAELEQWVHPDLQPSLTILFDVAPDVAAERLALARSADRFEAEPIAFFGAVRAMYLKRAAANPARFFIVDGEQPLDAVRDQLDHLIRQWNG